MPKQTGRSEEYGRWVVVRQGTQGQTGCWEAPRIYLKTGITEMLVGGARALQKALDKAADKAEVWDLDTGHTVEDNA